MENNDIDTRTDPNSDTRSARTKQLAQTVLETAERSFQGVGLQAYAQSRFSAACAPAEDGSGVPQITVLDTRLARSCAGFSLSVTVSGRHGILSAGKRFFSDEAYVWDPDRDASRTYEEVSALLETCLHRFAENLAEGSLRLASQDLPGVRAFFDSASADLGEGSLLHQVSEAVWARLGDKLTVRCCDAMQDNHGRRQRLFRNLPAGAVRTGISSVSLSPVSGERHGRPYMGLQLQVSLDCGISGVKQETFDPLRMLAPPEDTPALSPSAMEEILSHAYEAAAGRLVSWACGRAPLAVLRLFDGPGCPPESLHQLLRDGETQFGAVSLRWAGPKLENGRQICCLPEKNGVRYVLMDSFSPQSRRDSLPYSSVAWAYGTPLALETLSSLPDDLATVLRLSSALNAILLETAVSSREDTPAVSLTVRPDLRLTLESSRLSLDLSGEMSRHTEDLDRYFRDLAQRLLKEQHLCRTVAIQQMKILRTLNPTELAVLRTVWSAERTWYTDAAARLDGTVLTQKPYVDICLNRLARLEVPTADSLSAPLLSAEVHRNEHHVLYKIYVPGAKLEQGVLASAMPRDFTFQELPLMKPACRELWAANQLLCAETPEARREALIAVQLQMPRAFLVRFVQSPEGQAFFRSFDGPDALQAHLAIQHLPGCRKLADSIWPRMAA